MSHDPRLTLIETISAALAAGVPLVNGNVGVMRSEPLWDTEELPILLLNFAHETVEEDSAACRMYRHTLDLDIFAYCRGSERKNTYRIINIANQVAAVMREWQSITVADVQPDCPRESRDDYIVESIWLGDSVDWFQSPNTSIAHAGVCLGYKAAFQSDGNATGENGPGIPARNVLTPFMQADARMDSTGDDGYMIESETELPQ